MNQIQLDRWVQLSVGLARTFRYLPRTRREELAIEIENCIDWVMCNGLDQVEHWDSCTSADGRHIECASDRVNQYLEDNGYDQEKEYKDGRVEVIRTNFGGKISACVRAGFDGAVAPSAGVLGFTVGDLRKVFDGNIREWVNNYFHPPLPANAASTERVWL